jgi:signal peptidase II
MSPTPFSTVSRKQAAMAYALAALVCLLDFSTKYIAQVQLELGQATPITSFFNYVHYRNTGAAFGILADYSGWQRWFLAGIALLVSCGLIWWIRREANSCCRLAYALILGGAISNGVERVFNGYVTDFLDFHYAGWHWPAFNVADMALCAAVALLIGLELTGRGSAPTAQLEKTS